MGASKRLDLLLSIWQVVRTIHVADSDQKKAAKCHNMNRVCFFSSYVSRRRHTRVECIAGPRLRFKFLSCFTLYTTCFKMFTCALSLIRVQCGRIPSPGRTFYLFSVFFTVFYLFYLTE